MILVLYIAAGALEVTGLTFVAYGFYRNWREHAAGQDFWARPKRWTAHQWRRLVNGARWVVRKRPIRPKPVTASVNALLPAMVLNAHGVVHLSQPPDPETHLSEFAEVIHERISTLHVDVSSLKYQLGKEETARKEAEAKLREYVDSQRNDTRAETHGVAVSGLWWEFVGWSFLLVGIVLGTVANIAAYVAS